MDYLKLAIEKSEESVAKGGFPAGVVIVKGGEIVATGISVGNKLHDPTSHGEIAAIREVCKKLKTSDLSGCVLYSSLESCSMCLSAAMWASIPKIVYACDKEAVPADFYGGEYDTQEINKKFSRPLELVHEEKHQKQALKVINCWLGN
jgi:tRNA(Arg) A34 adenosine deaminase TadA